MVTYANIKLPAVPSSQQYYAQLHSVMTGSGGLCGRDVTITNNKRADSLFKVLCYHGTFKYTCSICKKYHSYNLSQFNSLNRQLSSTDFSKSNTSSAESDRGPKRVRLNDNINNNIDMIDKELEDFRKLHINNNENNLTLLEKIKLRRLERRERVKKYCIKRNSKMYKLTKKLKKLQTKVKPKKRTSPYVKNAFLDYKTIQENAQYYRGFLNYKKLMDNTKQKSEIGIESAFSSRSSSYYGSLCYDSESTIGWSDNLFYDITDNELELTKVIKKSMWDCSNLEKMNSILKYQIYLLENYLKDATSTESSI